MLLREVIPLIRAVRQIARVAATGIGNMGVSTPLLGHAICVRTKFIKVNLNSERVEVWFVRHPCQLRELVV